MAAVSPFLSRGVQALSDADKLRMPGHDTRFAAGTLPATAPRPRRRRSHDRTDLRAWLAALRRRPTAPLSH